MFEIEGSWNLVAIIHLIGIAVKNAGFKDAKLLLFSVPWCQWKVKGEGMLISWGRTRVLDFFLERTDDSIGYENYAE